MAEGFAGSVIIEANDETEEVQSCMFDARVPSGQEIANANKWEPWKAAPELGGYAGLVRDLEIVFGSPRYMK